jgi:hypothetical protein
VNGEKMRKPSEVFINGKSLEDILEAHSNWLNSNSQKDCNDLCIKDDLFKADLLDAVLTFTNLSRADLSGTDLSHANLSGANLSRANLSGTDLSGTDLSHANLSGANLSRANLSGTDLSYANLSGANLSGANLRCADLIGANLSCADLTQIIYNNDTKFFAIQCPEEGSFIGYKKCNGFIVKLEIPSDAKRSSATSRKCRCSKAKTLSITNLDGSDSDILAIASDFDPNFIYKIGEVVEVKDFDENRWNECSSGIHYFITRNEAVSY